MKRPYKEVWPYDKVMQAIQDGANSHFDPELVELFFLIQPQILKIQKKWRRADEASDPYAHQV